MDNIKTSRVPIPRLDGTNSPKISSSSNHTEVTSVEFNPVLDFASGEFNLDCVTDFAVWVGVSDCSAVVGAEEWNAVFADADEFHTAKFVRGFFFVDPVRDISSFCVVDKSKVFPGPVNSNDIHETSWVFFVSPDFSVDFDKSFVHDLGDLFPVERVFQTVSDEDREG